MRCEIVLIQFRFNLLFLLKSHLKCVDTPLHGNIEEKSAPGLLNWPVMMILFNADLKEITDE